MKKSIQSRKRFSESIDRSRANWPDDANKAADAIEYLRKCAGRVVQSSDEMRDYYAGLFYHTMNLIGYYYILQFRQRKCHILLSAACCVKNWIPGKIGKGSIMGMKTLILDDEATFREPFAEMLSEDGHEVHCVENLADAREQLRNHLFHLAMINIVLGRPVPFDHTFIALGAVFQDALLCLTSAMRLQAHMRKINDTVK